MALNAIFKTKTFLWYSHTKKAIQKCATKTIKRNDVDVFHFLKIKLTAWASYRTTRHLCKQPGLAGASNIRHKRKWHYFVKKLATNVGLRLSFYILNWLHIYLPFLTNMLLFCICFYLSLSLSLYV